MYEDMLSLYIILFLTVHLKFTLSAEQYALYKKLFVDQDYNPELRPVKNVTRVVDVKLDYRMTSVDDLDETNEFLSSAGWLKITWRDEFLTWDESEFNNLKRISLPATKAWGPDLVFNNGYDNSVRVFKEQTMIILSSNGSVTWWAPANWRTKCRVNISKFPFDSQICKIEISQYTSDYPAVSLTGHTGRKLDQLFQKHGEWEVTHLSLNTKLDDYDGEASSRIIVDVVLTRRPLYNIITFILPVVSLSVLNLATFLVPVECGENISLCVSVLLSYAVFLSSITSNLPNVSDNVSIFGIYLLVMLIVKVTSCFIAVIVVKVHTTTEKDHHKVTLTTITTDDIPVRKFTPSNRAAKINRYSFYLILGLTALMTGAFFSWMATE